ncbi:MAG TPA: signal peptidase II [Holophaga sp.]|nr:signal peptidase II [Holophaga sp.]HPS67798.1 signal peptidase II [Holophaga sp.]
MRTRGLGQRSLWLLLPVLALALDLLSKAWILARFSPGDVVPVIPGFFNLTLGLNPGAIFGFLADSPAAFRIPFFAGVGLAALGFFGYEFLKEGPSALQRAALGLILGGALGNGYDRVIRGAVVDFLDFVFDGWHYWAFNLADSFIVCGAILLGWSLLRPTRSSLEGG